MHPLNSSERLRLATCVCLSLCITTLLLMFAKFLLPKLSVAHYKSETLSVRLTLGLKLDSEEKAKPENHQLTSQTAKAVPLDEIKNQATKQNIQTTTTDYHAPISAPKQDKKATDSRSRKGSEIDKSNDPETNTDEVIFDPRLRAKMSEQRSKPRSKKHAYLQTYMHINGSEVIQTANGCMELKPIITDRGTQHFWFHMDCGPDNSLSKKMADDLRQAMESRR